MDSLNSARINAIRNICNLYFKDRISMSAEEALMKVNDIAYENSSDNLANLTFSKKLV